MPNRYLQFKCERCGTTVASQDDTRSLICAACGTELIVPRSHGAIALKTKSEQRDLVNSPRFVPDLVEKLTSELTKLNIEVLRIGRRRTIVAAVGGCCALIFGAFAISALLGNNPNIGITMLLCAGGCSWFVLFVQRDGAIAAAKMPLKIAELRHRIRENQRICFASKKGIHRIAMDLFLREVRYYPAWIQHSRGYVPTRVTDAVKVDADSVRLTIGGSDYLFTLAHEHRNEERAQVELSLSVDNSIVLSAGAEILENQLTIRASGHYVNRIVDGAWIEELFALWAEAELSHHEQMTRNRNTRSPINPRG